jgi:hypothetical protein
MLPGDVRYSPVSGPRSNVGLRPQAKIQSRSQRADSSALTACDGDHTPSIAAHPPLRVVPQLLYAERKADAGSHGHVDYPP